MFEAEGGQTRQLRVDVLVAEEVYQAGRQAAVPLPVVQHRPYEGVPVSGRQAGQPRQEAAQGGESLLPVSTAQRPAELEASAMAAGADLLYQSCCGSAGTEVCRLGRRPGSGQQGAQDRDQSARPGIGRNTGQIGLSARIGVAIKCEIGQGAGRQRSGGDGVKQPPNKSGLASQRVAGRQGRAVRQLARVGEPALDQGVQLAAPVLCGV